MAGRGGQPADPAGGGGGAGGRAGRRRGDRPGLSDRAIAAGTSENGVARAVRDALRTAVGHDYDVELDDGEDVLLNRRLFRRRFEVRIESNGVRGVRVNRDQE